MDGPCWYAQRKTASFEFSVSKFKDFMTDVFIEHATELGDVIADAAGREFDLQRLFSKFTLESICKIAYGVQLGCLRQDMPFEKAFDQATQYSSSRFLNPFYPVLKLLRVGQERRLADALELINSFSTEIIAKRRALDAQSLSEHSDLLSRFMMHHDEDGAPHTDGYLRDIVVNFVLAGRDTTSNCLSWLFFLLARHPHVLAKLREEMARNGLAGDDGGAPQRPTYTHVHHGRMPLLHAAVTETLRLYPSVPTDLKFCATDDVLPSGHFVPAGASIAYDPYVMGRQQALWGPDAATFSPERHLVAADAAESAPSGGEGDSKSSAPSSVSARSLGGEFGPSPATQRFVRPSPFKFTAFQAGKRTCLGMDMAYLEVKTAAVCLLQRYDFSLAADHREGYARSLTLPLHELRMTFRERQTGAPHLPHPGIAAA